MPQEALESQPLPVASAVPSCEREELAEVRRDALQPQLRGHEDLLRQGGENVAFPLTNIRKSQQDLALCRLPARLARLSGVRQQVSQDGIGEVRGEVQKVFQRAPPQFVEGVLGCRRLRIYHIHRIQEVWADVNGPQQILILKTHFPPKIEQITVEVSAPPAQLVQVRGERA